MGADVRARVHYSIGGVREVLMQKFMLIALVGMSLSSHAVAAEVTLSGTYKLVSEQRTIVDTGEVISTTSSRGYISYDAEVKFYMSSIEAAATSFAIQARTAPVHANDEIEGAIATLAANPGAGLIVMPDLFNLTNRDLIVPQAARYRVPTIYFLRSYADSGGLISYGPDFAEQYPPAAAYIDRILRGEKPADLPIQMPTKIEIVINLKTAKALGLDVPLQLQARADKVIE
jgi:ABC transporter substrate binding protein